LRRTRDPFSPYGSHHPKRSASGKAPSPQAKREQDAKRVVKGRLPRGTRTSNRLC
jgi:hypothetical protein